MPARRSVAPTDNYMATGTCYLGASGIITGYGQFSHTCFGCIGTEDDSEFVSMEMCPRREPKKACIPCARLRNEVDGLIVGIKSLNESEASCEGKHMNRPSLCKSPNSNDIWPYWNLGASGLTGTWRATPRSESAHDPNNLASAPAVPLEGPRCSSYLVGQLPVPENQDKPEYQGEEQSSADPNIDESTKKTKQLPQATQWASLRELRLSSRLQYEKFRSLTAKYESRGIKKLRKMYGSAAGMLDAGIMTFGDALGGQEPSSLKEVFAFTCLSYVMSKLLRKHGRMESHHVLADTGLWRWAIKNEKDRLIYDEVIKIIWPEIEFLATRSKATDSGPTSSLLELPRVCKSSADLSLDSDSTRPAYAPSSMMAHSMATLSEHNSMKRARATGGSYIATDTPSALDGQANDLGLVSQASHHGLQERVIELLQETSSHDDFKFADFLNLDCLASDNNLESALTPHPPGHSSQPCQSVRPIETINPKQLRISYAQPEYYHMESLINPNTNPKLLVQEESFLSEPDYPPLLSYFLEYLVETAMFQIVVEFIKFVGTLGDLLYHLSGCGITSRHKKNEIEDHSRRVHDFGEFVNEALKLVFEPIKTALGDIDKSFDAVLCMAENFVRLGRLQTVREIEEYIITTSRYLTCDYDSFVTLLSKTLRQCLSASDRMPWDHIYPSASVDQEDYSILYVETREAEEVAWALLNLKTKNNVEPTPPDSALATKLNVAQREGCSLSTPDPGQTKKQKFSPDEPSVAHCQYPKCKKSYRGKEARVNLRRHVRTVHEGYNPVICPKCGLRSSRRDNLRKHFLLKHQGENLPEILTCKTKA